MRVLFPLLAACAVLSACSSNTPVAKPAVPSVSYQVTGNDLGPSNVQAQNYCQQYGHAAQFQGLKPSSAGNAAVYTCDGPVPGPSTAAPRSLSGSSTAAPAVPPAAPGAPTSLSTPQR